MAKATKVPAVTKVVEPEKIVLELTQAEANYLRETTGHDTGNESYYIYNALGNVADDSGHKSKVRRVRSSY